MGIRKWLMKQQWRVVQIRGIWGLFYGILLLAISYYEFIPFFLSMGSIGPFAFAVVILFSFLVLGYIYDKVLVMWAPSQEVAVERSPYQYVPSPKDKIFWFPLYSTILDSLEKLADEFSVDKQLIEDTRIYFAKLQTLTPRREDIEEGIGMREEYISKHQFADIYEDE